MMSLEKFLSAAPKEMILYDKPKYLDIEKEALRITKMTDCFQLGSCMIFLHRAAQKTCAIAFYGACVQLCVVLTLTVLNFH